MHNTRAQETKNKKLKTSGIPIYRFWGMLNGEKNNRRELDGYVQSDSQSMDVYK